MGVAAFWKLGRAGQREGAGISCVWEGITPRVQLPLGLQQEASYNLKAASPLDWELSDQVKLKVNDCPGVVSSSL